MAKIKCMHRMAAWIAIFAILCHALMPMVAQMHAATSSQIAVEICTISGIWQVVLEDGKAAPSPIGHLHVKHRAFCFDGDHCALPSSPMAAAFIARVVMLTPVPLPAAAAPRMKTRRHTAAPRGPPSLS